MKKKLFFLLIISTSFNGKLAHAGPLEKIALFAFCFFQTDSTVWSKHHSYLQCLFQEGGKERFDLTVAENNVASCLKNSNELLEMNDIDAFWGNLSKVTYVECENLCEQYPDKAIKACTQDIPCLKVYIKSVQAYITMATNCMQKVQGGVVSSLNHSLRVEKCKQDLMTKSINTNTSDSYLSECLDGCLNEPIHFRDYYCEDALQKKLGGYFKVSECCQRLRRCAGDIQSNLSPITGLLNCLDLCEDYPETASSFCLDSIPCIINTETAVRNYLLAFEVSTCYYSVLRGAMKECNPQANENDNCYKNGEKEAAIKACKEELRQKAS